MNTREIAQIDWDEQELRDCLTAFVRLFHRFPSQDDLEQFHADGFGRLRR